MEPDTRLTGRSPVVRARCSGPAVFPTLSGVVPWSAQRAAWLVFAVAFAVNVNTLTNGWALDDTLLITKNTFTKQGLAGIPEIWSNDVFVGFLGQGGVETGGRYRPLSHTVFAVHYALVGDRPWLGHLTNVLLYAITCALLFHLLSRLWPESARQPFQANVPLLAALLFALHPVHAEVVANIKSLDEILAMLFALLAAWFAVDDGSARRLRSVLFSTASFFLALAAKENAITFLAIVPLVVWYRSGEARRTLLATAVLLVPAALYFFLRTAALGSAPRIAWQDSFLTNPFHGATFAEHLATAALILFQNVTLLVMPWPLTTDYYPPMVPVVGWSDARAILGALIAVSVGVFGLAGVRGRSVLAFGAMWFLITYPVVSNVFINLGTPMNDRFLFMPSAGFVCVVAVLLLRGLDRLRSPTALRIGRSLLLTVLLACAMGSVLRNRDWQDDLTLFAHDVKVSDNSARCHVMYAKLLMERAGTSDAALKHQRLNDAEEHLERGLELYPDYALAHGLLGKHAMDRKDYHGATDHFSACLQRDSTEEVALKNLAFVGRRMGEMGDHTGAERAFRAAIQFDPHGTEPYLFLADALMRTGRPDSSIMWLDRLLSLEPKNANAHRLKGEVYAVYLRNAARAEESFLKAHELAPRDPAVTDNLAVAAFKRQDYARALAFFLKGVEARPADAPRLRNVSETYRMMGDATSAADYAQRAMKAEGRTGPP